MFRHYCGIIFSMFEIDPTFVQRRAPFMHSDLLFEVLNDLEEGNIGLTEEQEAAVGAEFNKRYVS